MPHRFCSARQSPKPSPTQRSQAGLQVGKGGHIHIGRDAGNALQGLAVKHTKSLRDRPFLSMIDKNADFS